MGSNTVLWGTIGVYIALLVGVGIAAGRSSKSIADLTVGGRQAGAWLSALSYGTAYFSAVMFVGYAGSAGYSFGLWGILAGLGNVVFGTLLAWLVLARRTRAIAAELNLHTMPEFLEKRYDSRAMKFFACVVIFIFLIPYSASVYKGLGSIARVLLGFESDRTFMIIIAALAALLLLFGGYLVQARADFIQGVIMMVGIVMLILYVLKAPQVNWFSGIAEYAKTDAGLPKLDGKQWWALLSLVLMTSFGTWGLPHMIQKYFGIKNDQQAKRGIFISTFFALLVAGGGYFIGSLCHLFLDAKTQTELEAYGKTFKDYIVPTMLKLANIPTVLMGVVLVLLLAASVSTLCSVTLTASSTLVLDFFKGLRPKTEEKALRLGTKLVCLAFIAVSFLVATSKTPILDLMSYSWGIISGSFLAPYVLSLYYKGTNKIGAWAGIATGFVIAIIPAIYKMIDVFQNNDASQGIKTIAGYGTQFAVVAMASSVAVCLLVSVITGKVQGKKNVAAA
ncbi:MAG: sodium:solute symporter family protein [Oscillospiraceae bacterium]|jgi:SSS family solute:Na+ symporter/sodium/proline symporter|nr:sodium:solute symporter family protein [Oscillospiraceae bacterium]